MQLITHIDKQQTEYRVLTVSIALAWYHLLSPQLMKLTVNVMLQRLCFGIKTNGITEKSSIWTAFTLRPSE